MASVGARVEGQGGEYLTETMLILAPSAVASWTGPHIRPVFNAQGLSALSIDSMISAPGFIVGNTQGGLKDEWANWAVELESAKAAGVRIVARWRVSRGGAG